VFQQTFRGASTNFPGCFNKLSGVLHQTFRGASTNFPGCFNKLSGVLQQTFRGASTNFPGCFNKLSGVLQQTFRGASDSFPAPACLRSLKPAIRSFGRVSGSSMSRTPAQCNRSASGRWSPCLVADTRGTFRASLEHHPSMASRALVPWPQKVHNMVFWRIGLC